MTKYCQKIAQSLLLGLIFWSIFCPLLPDTANTQELPPFKTLAARSEQQHQPKQTPLYHFLLFIILYSKFSQQQKKTKAVEE
jgi:hypothetical protein